jgi:hypothetical protein
VPRRLELAIQKSGRILSLQRTAEQFLCGAIRGDQLHWPAAAETGFYEQFLERAIANGVDMLVCHCLRLTSAWQELPKEVREPLEQRSRNAIAVEMARSQDLSALLKGMAGQGLELLLLKGSALAYTHYPQPHLRARVDTDVLIDPAGIRQVRALLDDLDYDLVGWTYKSHQFNATREKYGGRVIRYDVHWRANNGAKYARTIGFAEALEESVSVPGVTGGRTLGPVHSLMLACMHWAGTIPNHPDRLIWLYDMHLLVSAMSAEELSTFAARAKSGHIQEECHAALVECSRCFGTIISPNIMPGLAGVSRQPAHTSRFARSQLAVILDDLGQLPDWSSRLDLLREYLFPPADYLLSRYGKEDWYWVPLLYCRYLFGGMFQRISLH